MSGPDDWSSVPSHDPTRGTQDTDGLEARPAAGTSAAGDADGRDHGRPAPQYGEYAPEGWVNPVLVEQERRERAERAHESDRPVVGRPVASRSSERADRDRTQPDTGPAPVASRYGASPLDFVLTVGLLFMGLWTTVQALAVGTVASATRTFVERQYTEMADPAGLSQAALVRAGIVVVCFVLVAWWSVRRLRARRRTFWVPLSGGVVASFLGAVPLLLVVFRDPAVVEYVHRIAGG